MNAFSEDMKEFEYPPGNLQGDTWLVVLLFVSQGKADARSLVYLSLMPVFVARAVSCLGHTKKKEEEKNLTEECDSNLERKAWS